MTNPEREQSAAKRRARSRIPTFKTIEEAAEFWDTHDSAEFEDEFEDVTNVRFVVARPKKAITVRLPEDSLATLTSQAHEKGIGRSTLVRMWILEHLTETP